MPRHILRMIWNRKRSNALLLLEILISSVVLFLVLSQGLHALKKYILPLGFDYQNSYAIRINEGSRDNAHNNAQLRDALVALEAFESVSSVGAIMPVPFVNSTWRTTFGYDSDEFLTNMHLYIPGAEIPLNMKTSMGQWPIAADLANQRLPIVVNYKFLLDYYKDEGQEMVAGRINPIGRVILEKGEDEEEPKIIVGVVPYFRAKGELTQDVATYFHPVEASGKNTFVDNLVVHLQPGTAAGEFEEQAIRAIQAVAPDWTLRMTAMSELRDSQLREKALPLLIAGLVVGFLLLMVAFGLIGVLWQSVIRRRKEIGLRRALGAGRREIFLQLLGEIAILCLLALAGAWLIILQLPFMGFNATIGWGVFLTALLLTTASILLLSLLAGLYPGWLSSRIMPSEALHYE